jgi:hypothetical protein
MSDLTSDTVIDEPTDIYSPSEGVPDDDQRKGRPPADEAEKELVKKLIRKIRADKKHHEKAFQRMHRDMNVAMNGRTDDWSEKNYKANITGRHINQAVGALYAKNPKVVARRQETIDFQIWDESDESLKNAFMIMQQAQQMAQAQTIDEMGNPVTPPIPPEAMQAFQQAQQLLEDFQQGMQRRDLLTKVGKTLEILFGRAMRDQQPLDFKTSMKQMVRRAKTTGVGYVELGFRREMGADPMIAQQIQDVEARLQHLRKLLEDAAEGEIEEGDAESAELEAELQALMAEPEVIIKEGLVFDFPLSTKVIPDKLCRNLVGFIGSRHLTLEYLFTKEQIQEMFGVDLKGRYTAYRFDGKPNGSDYNEDGQGSLGLDDEKERERQSNDLVCVWKMYDKPTGNVYYLADGYDEFLRDPGPPDVYVDGFWPVYALTFNEVESETKLFPPSDVTLMIDMQSEYNRSRQGMREHRQASRPRWVFPNGALDEEDQQWLASAEPHTATGINMDPGTEIAKVLQPVPTAGVDPNLYETGQIFQDIQLVVGTQEAMLGGLAKATATESSIAASSSASTVNSAIDDLDGFLTRIARAGGQIMFREMSEEQVIQIAGRGAVWPQQTLEEIANEVFLEVAAGSTGKPNQASEIDNWSKMLPFLIQMPGISPTWLAQETLRRLDDRLDLTDAIAHSVPSLVALNNMMGKAAVGGGEAGPDGRPAEQPPGPGGDTGGDNGPRPPPEAQAGSEPAFGSNQV